MSESELTVVGGLWVPQQEARTLSDERFRRSEETGTLDLDVSKVSKSIACCHSFDLALDIGAHVGATVILLARHFKQVVAFEAIPSTFSALTKNTESLSNVLRHNCAVANVSGEMFFEHVPHHGQLSHALTPGDALAFETRSECIGPIQAHTIDSFEFPNVSFIKIDVEGFEGPVVEGAANTIRRCRPVILVEQGGNEVKFHGRPRDEATALLREMGMQMVDGLPFKKDRVFQFC